MAQRELRRFKGIDFVSILGIGRNSICDWVSQHINSFPKKDKSDLYEGREMFLWWLSHKAKPDVALPVLEALKERFEPKVEEVKPAEIPEPVVVAAPVVAEGMPNRSGVSSEEEFQRHQWMIKLRRDSAKLEQDLGRWVSIDQVKDILQEFAKNLRADQQRFQNQTGHPASQVFEGSFVALEDKLQQLGMGQSDESEVDQMF